MKHHIRQRLTLSLISMGLMAFGSQDATPNGYHLCGEAQVSEVLSGNRMVLDSGSKLLLDAVQAPMIPREGQVFKAWPLASWSRSKVADLVEGQTLTFFCGAADYDRHGERVALVKFQNGTWLHTMMLKDGLARVALLSKNIPLAEELYAVEKQTREEGRGLWDHPAYAVLDTGKPTEIITARYQVLSGVVQTVSITKSKTYINFGSDYRTDFTLEMTPKVTRDFTRTGIDVEALAGANIEARGWVDWRGGPRIILTHPSQINLLP